MRSEPVAVGQSSAYRRLQEIIAARNAEWEALQAWEAANPQLAADWREADKWEHERREEKLKARVDADIWHRAGDELRKLGVPLDAVDASDKPEETDATGVARAFIAADPTNIRFLLLMGRKGTGKTVAAALVLRKAAADWLCIRNDLPSGGTARQLPAEFAMAGTFARLSGYAVDDKAWFERLCSVHLLVLDDFGAEYMGPFGAAMLDELLTRRHGARLRTVITTNLGKVDLKARIGDRLHDRISTSCLTCVSVDESRRKRPTL